MGVCQWVSWNLDVLIILFMFNLKQHFLRDPSMTFLYHGSYGAVAKPVFHEYQRWQREMEFGAGAFLSEGAVYNIFR